MEAGRPQKERAIQGAAAETWHPKPPGLDPGEWGGAHSFMPNLCPVVMSPPAPEKDNSDFLLERWSRPGERKEPGKQKGSGGVFCSWED